MKLLYCLLCLYCISAINLHSENKISDAKIDDRWDFLHEIVATVNKEKISKANLLSFLTKRVSPMQLKRFDSRNLKSYTNEVLGQYINQMILADLAAKDGYPSNLALFKKNFENQLSSATKNQKESFDKYLKKEGLTLDAFVKEKASGKDELRQAAIDLWTQEHIEPEITVTDSEIKSFYDKSADLIRVSQILIKSLNNSPEEKLKSKKEAEAILKQLKDGADFNKLTSISSDCTNPNGNLGEFGRGKMVQEFEDVAFNMKKGDISNVFETMFGFHIIRLDDARKRKLSPLNSKLTEQIKEQIKLIKTQDILIEKLDKAKKNYSIKVLF